MKYLIRTLVLTIALIALFSCEEDPIPNYVEGYESSDTSIYYWRQPFFADTIASFPCESYLVNDNLLFYSTEFAYGDFALHSYSMQGIKNWTLDEGHLGTINYADVYNTLLIKDQIVNSCYGEYYGIDVASGKMLWAEARELGNAYISANDEMGLIFIISGMADGKQIIEMKSTTESEFEQVFIMQKKIGYGSGIPAVNSFLNSEGDTMLVFQVRRITGLVSQNKLDFYCFNVTKHEMAWSLEDLKDGDSNVSAPEIQGDYIYFLGKWTMYKIHKETGEIAWENEMYWDSQGSNFVFSNDYVIFNLDNGDLVALNKSDGKLAWANEGLSGCCVDLNILNETIYMPNREMFIIDAKNGELLHKIRSPTRTEPTRGDASFLKLAAIDKDQTRIFVGDYYYMYCLKHPEL